MAVGHSIVIYITIIVIGSFLNSNRLLCLMAIALHFTCYKILLVSLSKFDGIDIHSQIMKSQKTSFLRCRVLLWCCINGMN